MAEDGEDDECEEEEAGEEEELQLTEDDDEDDCQAAEVDDYLAQSLGLVPGSPQPPSAYVGTVAYELSDEGQPVPYAPALPAVDDESPDLVKQLAELEHLVSTQGQSFEYTILKAIVLYLKSEAEQPRQQIAHRRAALYGRQKIERWHSASVPSS